MRLNKNNRAKCALLLIDIFTTKWVLAVDIIYGTQIHFSICLVFQPTYMINVPTCNSSDSIDSKIYYRNWPETSIIRHKYL